MKPAYLAKAGYGKMTVKAERILHITDLYPPLIGGMEGSVQNFARELACRGYEVAVATMAPPGAPRSEVDESGVRVYRIDQGWARRVRRANPTGRPYHPAAKGEFVFGTYQRRLDLASGRFATIDNGFGFSLVPWSPALERHFGRDVSGIVQANRVEWSFARARGPSIGL